MKHLNNTKTTLLLSAAMFAATGAFAQQQHLLASGNVFNSPAVLNTEETPNALQMNVLQAANNALTFHINVENPRLERVKLFIIDRTGNVLHEESLPLKAHFETRYNLEMLEDGAYKIVLSTRQQEIERDINISTAVSRTVSMK